jgi:hypothetical protein
MFVYDLLQFFREQNVVDDTRILAASRGFVPKGEGPFVTLVPEGGPFPQKTHNSIANSYDRPEIRCLIRHDSFMQAYAIANRLRDLSVTVHNQYLGLFSLPIESLTQQGGEATAIVSSTELLYPNQTLQLSGADQPEYNGFVAIAAITSPTSFMFSVAAAAVSPATGTISAAYNGTWYLSVDLVRDIYDASVDGSNRARVGFLIRAFKRTLQRTL